MNRLIGPAAAVVLAACTTIIEEPNALHSFDVALSEGDNLHTGTAKAPVDYISGTSCATQACPGTEECIGYCAISGVSCASDGECPTGEYCAKICAKPVYLDVRALGRDGLPFPDAGDLWVHVSVVPGMVPPPYRYFQLDAGRIEKAKVYIAQAVGTSHIWVEDVGMGFSPDLYGQCNNGQDDDNDGWIDLADPDCLQADDPRESPASFATGLSPPFYFESPRIWHIQYTDQVSTSPLDGQNVQVDEGRMVVTNIVANGFFVTDLDFQKPILDSGLSGYYNSFFFYTFNKPEGIRYGDVLCYFSGGVVEYEGNTQMTFPTYFGEEDEECEGLVVPEEVPDPVDVTDLIRPEDPDSSSYSTQVMNNARALEPFESSLVRIRDVDLSSRYIACDSDEDGAYPSGSDDDVCRDACQADEMCTQLESFFKYSQLSAYAAAGKKVYFGLDMLKYNMPLDIPFIGAKDESANCPDQVDPETGKVVVKNPHKVTIGDSVFVEYTCPGGRLASVSGNLRHIYLCDPKPGKKESCSLQMTMLIPRFDEDFVFEDR